MENTIAIAGAGPAGLCAAINLAKAGYRVTVHESATEVGRRLSGDFQGLENWSTREDVSRVLERMNLRVNFLCAPFAEGDLYTPDGSKHHFRSPEPLFYLVRRGSEPGTLDWGLKEQAIAAGVDLRFESRLQEMEGVGIVAAGPHGADAVAVGLLFDTDMPDQASAILDDRLAPKGYAYLLVHQRKATLATVLFREYRRDRECLKRTVEAFDRLVGLRMTNAREFGGYGNFYLRSSAVHGGKPYAGEAAGFQDCLWGFGMRYALLSGYLAARSIIEREDYNRLWQAQVLPLLETSLSNRYLFEKLGNKGYTLFAKGLKRAARVRESLYRHYNPSLVKRMVFPLARRAYATRVKDWSCTHQNCDCVWCRCQRQHGAAA